MKKSDAFGGYHPLVGFLYFAVVLLCTMMIRHPVGIFISLVCAVLYFARLKGVKAVVGVLPLILPLLCFTAFINALFNHKGATVLFTLPSGNPLTLESLLFGTFSGIMLVAVLLWFGCLQQVMTEEKFIYLFGRTIPSVSLVLSMIFRFIPCFVRQFTAVREVQKARGQGLSYGVVNRIRQAVTLFLSVTAWSLENAVETADSMKSRGYGLRGRSSYSIYLFGWRDKVLTAVFCLIGFCLLSAGVSGQFGWQWFPQISSAQGGPFMVFFFILYTAFCLTPLLVDDQEEKQWKFFQSDS